MVVVVVVAVLRLAAACRGGQGCCRSLLAVAGESEAGLFGHAVRAARGTHFCCKMQREFTPSIGLDRQVGLPRVDM